MPDVRHRQPWVGIWGKFRRFSVRHTKTVATTLAVSLITVWFVPWFFGMIALPRKVAAQSIEIAQMDSTLDVLIGSNDTTRRISALDVSFQCLDADSATFAASWRTCAEAFYIAKLDPEFWKPRVRELERKAIRR